VTCSHTLSLTKLRLALASTVVSPSTGELLALTHSLSLTKLRLALASTVVFGFESHGTHDHILLFDRSGKVQSSTHIVSALETSLNNQRKEQLWPASGPAEGVHWTLSCYVLSPGDTVSWLRFPRPSPPRLEAAVQKHTFTLGSRYQCTTAFHDQLEVCLRTAK
jgi:hypothetical protein